MGGSDQLGLHADTPAAHVGCVCTWWPMVLLLTPALDTHTSPLHVLWPVPEAVS